MQYTDIAIVGGGLAGSTAAPMLGRAGIDTVMIDPHVVYPPDMRCEKIGGTQLERLRKTGLSEKILSATTLDGEVWEARFGYIVDKKPSDQHGIRYETLVKTTRAAIPDNVSVIHAKADKITASRERQKIVLSNGDEISARLIVLANGLNIGLRQTLEIEREVISPCHSITIGFDVVPMDREKFDFPALTYWPKRSSDRMAYLTLFPIGEAMRANFMVYRDMDDPWLREFRDAPEATMCAMMPNLQTMMGAFAVSGAVKIRPADLYETRGHRQAGVVVVGDAFATSCPAAGTGIDKVFTDVERLCNIHIPQWLATDGMDADKIAAFYDDPVKVACDTWSTSKAYYLRSLTLDNRLSWRAKRWARFLVRLAQGTLRSFRKRTKMEKPQPRNPATASPLHLDHAN